MALIVDVAQQHVSLSPYPQGARTTGVANTVGRKLVDRQNEVADTSWIERRFGGALSHESTQVSETLAREGQFETPRNGFRRLCTAGVPFARVHSGLQTIRMIAWARGGPLFHCVPAAQTVCDVHERTGPFTSVRTSDALLHPRARRR